MATSDSIELEDKIRTLISQFKLLNQDEIEVLVEKTIVDRFEKGTILLREGQVPTKCYMVVEGCVREYLLKDGEEKSTEFFMEGDTFTPPAEDGKPSMHYWECVEDCILTISNTSFVEEIRAALPRLDTVFQGIAIEKMNQARETWSLFVSSSPEERYLNLMETKPQLFNRVPHHQIASYIGMTPQSLSRIRKRVAEERK